MRKKISRNFCLFTVFTDSRIALKEEYLSQVPVWGFAQHLETQVHPHVAKSCFFYSKLKHTQHKQNSDSIHRFNSSPQQGLDMVLVPEAVFS